MSKIAFPDLSPTKGDGAAQLLQKIAQSHAAGLGQYGSARYADTDPHAGNFCCIIPNVDTTFTALVGNLVGGTGVVWAAGVPIYGIFTSFTMAPGGDVTAYNGQ